MTQVRKNAMRRTNNSEKMHDSICNEGAYSIVESQDFKNLKDSASAGCYTTPHIMHMRNAWRKDNNNLWRKATQTRDSAHRLQRELSQSSEDAHKAAQAVQMLEAQLTHIHKERTTVERLCGEINRSMETMQAALTVVKEQQLGGSSGSEIEMFLGTFGRRRVPKSPNPLVRNVLMLEDRIRSIQKQRVKDIRWRRIPHYSFLLMRDADLLELEKLRDAVEQNAEWQSAMREVEKSALHDMTLPQMHSLQGNKEKY